MLILNGKKFARTDAEFTASLFDPTGTCVGFYKPLKRKIDLMDPQKVRIGVVNEHGLIVAATRLKDGRWWYNFADIPQIGRYASHAQYRDEGAAALKLCES